MMQGRDNRNDIYFLPIIPKFQHSTKIATDVWADQVLNGLLDVAYHHLVMAIAWQLRIVIMMNRRAGLNLITQAATEAVQQWSRDIKKMRMGILVVIHTFGADMKWHPHIHLIVTGGGLSLDGKRWIQTDPRFLMHHGGLKKRWKYQVCTRMKKAHREDQLSGVLFDTSPISTSP